jgi:cation transport ATPase
MHGTIGQASKRGVIIESGEALEQMGTILQL